MNKNTLKSIGAIFGGMVLIVALSIVTDVILEKLGAFPPANGGTFTTWMLVVALSYRSVYAVMGGYVTASLAPGNPIRHAIILGTLGLVLSTIGAITMWDKGAHWYAVLLAVTAFPTSWLGGKIKAG